MEATLAVAEKAKPAPIEIKNGLVNCKTMEDAYRYAKYALASGMIPQSFKSPEAVLVAIQLGSELGMKPMQALQNIAVINGRPALWGKAVYGVVLQSGLMEGFEEWMEGDGDDLTACCSVKRKGIAEKRTVKFSVADAKKAGLRGRATWASYPKDMLAHKAKARAFTLFADVLCGLPYHEDIQDATPARELAEPKPDALLKQIGAATIVEEKPLAFAGEIPAEPVDTATGQLFEENGK